MFFFLPPSSTRPVFPYNLLPCSVVLRDSVCTAMSAASFLLWIYIYSWTPRSSSFSINVHPQNSNSLPKKNSGGVISLFFSVGPWKQPLVLFRSTYIHLMARAFKRPTSYSLLPFSVSNMHNSTSMSVCFSSTLKMRRLPLHAAVYFNFITHFLFSIPTFLSKIWVCWLRVLLSLSQNRVPKHQCLPQKSLMGNPCLLLLGLLAAWMSIVALSSEYSSILWNAQCARVWSFLSLWAQILAVLRPTISTLLCRQNQVNNPHMFAINLRLAMCTYFNAPLEAP